MAFIDIDPSLNISEEIADLMLSFLTDVSDFNRDLTVSEILAQKTRPGLNADVISNSIISRFPEIGLPSGPLVNGAANVMEALIRVIFEELVDSIQNQMRIDIGIFPGGTVSTNGANAAGPVPSIGTTITAQEGVGVAR